MALEASENAKLYAASENRNVKLSRLKKNKVMVMKAKIGTSFAIVVMILIIDAS